MTSALFQLDVLPFAIALGVGLVLALGAVLGFAGDGTGAEDAHEPGDAGADQGLSMPLRRRGGGPPLSVRLLAWSWGFAAAGLAIRPVLLALGASTSARAFSAGAIAIGTAVLLDAALRRFVRRFPLLESYATTRRALLGARGVVVVRVTDQTGTAQVRDAAGDLHQLTCRAEATVGALGPGTNVLVVDVDERGVYVVEPDPLA